MKRGGGGFWSRRSKGWWFSFVVIVLILLVIVPTFLKTGMLQGGGIDERDLTVWNYTSNGVIVNAGEFEIGGNKETCWLLIHGYTSTPDEMRALAGNISESFGDYVYVIRLKGHGEIPSHVSNLTLDDWYIQVEEKFDELGRECGNVNVVGFSFGGALATKLSEEKKVQRTYLIAPYLFASYRQSSVLSLELFIKYLSGSFNYIKKTQIAQVNDPKGQETYISYWNFPLLPVKNSRNFLDGVMNGLGEIKNPVLIQHSITDQTANFEGSRLIFNSISSSDKEIILFERSNHVLLADYDKNNVIKNIINFEIERR